MGILNENVSVDGDVMKVGDRSIKLISVKDPAVTLERFRN